MTTSNTPAVLAIMASIVCLLIGFAIDSAPILSF